LPDLDAALSHTPRTCAPLKEKKINAISLDSIVDDNHIRLVENMKAVSWNGLEAAFDVLEQRFPNRLQHPAGKPWTVLVLGTGMVGKHAVEAGTKLGNIERNNEHMQHNGSGSLVWTDWAQHHQQCASKCAAYSSKRTSW
jgi:alanine dehydrogenase